MAKKKQSAVRKVAGGGPARKKAGRRRPADSNGSDGGRATKLTDLVSSSIIDAVRAGNYLEAAAGAGGVSSNTVREWVSRGEGRDNDRPSTPLYATFAKALREAEAEAERRAVQVLSENVMGYRAQTSEVTEAVDSKGKMTGRHSKVVERTIRDPRSAIEFLKRRFPERWGDREKHKHEHEHRHEHRVMSPEDKRIASRVANARLRRATNN